MTCSWSGQDRGTGYLGPEQALLKDIGVETDARSNVKAGHGKYTTSLKGVFAAGDRRRQDSLFGVILGGFVASCG